MTTQLSTCIFKSIGKINKMGKWVPHQLTEVDRAVRVNVCNSLLIRQEMEPFLNRLVTGDEKWVLYVNVTHKKQGLNLGQKPLQDPKPGLHPKKVMLSVWWDISGVLHFELLEEGQTITADLYCQ